MDLNGPEFKRITEEWKANLRTVGLDSNNDIDRLVYGAYERSSYIMKLNSKIAAKTLSKNLLLISDQANKLAEKISKLPTRLREGISLSLINRESCNMDNHDTDVVEFLEKLSRAALHSDEVLLKKIPDGKYNPFLVEIADRLFSINTGAILALLICAKTQNQQKQALQDYWTEHKSRIIQATAYVIAEKYMHREDRHAEIEAARKSIKNNIDVIVENSIALTLKRYNAQQERRKKPPKN